MNIPFFTKENPSDYSCAPVCLKMALAYYGIERTMIDIYELADSMGDVHYTLPWGICCTAKEVGLNSAFVSKQPWGLRVEYYDDICKQTGLSRHVVARRINEQAAKCHFSPEIRLAGWVNGYRVLPERIIRDEQAIVIPTLWGQWGVQSHNVVLTSFNDTEVLYHDPNKPDGRDLSMAIEEFHKLWRNEHTDNDLLIISDKKLNIDGLSG